MYRGQPVCEQRLRGSLDMLDQTLEHVIEQPNLFVRKFNHAVDKRSVTRRSVSTRRATVPCASVVCSSSSRFSLDETAFALMTLSWSIHADRKRFLRFPRNGSD